MQRRECQIQLTRQGGLSLNTRKSCPTQPCNVLLEKSGVGVRATAAVKARFVHFTWFNKTLGSSRWSVVSKSESELWEKNEGQLISNLKRGKMQRISALEQERIPSYSCLEDNINLPQRNIGERIQIKLFALHYKFQVRESLQVVLHEKVRNPDGLNLQLSPPHCQAAASC